MTFTEQYTVQLTDGRIGYIDSIVASPFVGDDGFYAYVIGIDNSWADYIAI